MITVDEALKIILEQIPAGRTEEVYFMDALGRVVAEDIFSGIDIPPFDNSAMDGYALIAADAAGASKDAPAALDILEDVAAGYMPKKKIIPGTAIRIMTGAPIPEGADCVVMVEQTKKKGNQVEIFNECKKGQNIRLSGEDISSGELIINKGKMLTAADIGILATLGKEHIKVYRKPVVSVISTGDELVDVGEELKPGKIRNSNAYALASQVAESGGEPRIIGIARDNIEDLSEKIKKGLGADMLITSGGVSVGDYDMVKDFLNKAGKMVFWKVAMKPAKPLAFGMIDGKPVFGLPGNPSSSMVSFEQFVRPSIRKMGGFDNLARPKISVIVLDKIKKKPGRRNFVRVLLKRKGANIFAELSGKQSSAMLKTMSRAQGLLIIPEDIGDVMPGTILDAQVVYFDSLLEETPESGDISEKLSEISSGGKVSCQQALLMAQEIGVSSKELGKTADELKIKIRDCMLGCFE